MRCPECNCEENEFDEVLGERTCKDCGLVLVTELFEESVHILDSTGELRHSSDKGQLGSVIAGAGSYKFNKFGKQYCGNPRIGTCGPTYKMDNVLIASCNAWT